MALQELLDKNELQRLQDGFCKISGVSAYCLNHEGIKITRISGDDRYLHCMQERMALERVIGEDSLEDLAVEELEGRKLVAAIAIKARGQKELFWIVFKPEDMAEDEFYQRLELLRDASITFLQGKLQYYGAEAENVRNQANAQRMNRSLKLNQAMARLVHLLESSDPIETIMNEWLKTVSSFMELDTAQIFKLQGNDKFMDVICEWRSAGLLSFFDRTSHIPTYSFLRKRRSAILNADTVLDPEYQDVYQVGVKAMMLFPVGPKEGGMMVSLNHRRVHVFDAEEESFASDAIKILDNVLTRRIQRNSLDSAYVSMETVLDGISNCIMVRSASGRKLIYVNKLMQDTFPVELKKDHFEWLLKDEGKSPKDVNQDDEKECPAKDGAAEDGAEKEVTDSEILEHREVYYEEKNRWYDLTVTGVRWVDGGMVKMYSLFDVTEKKHYQGRIEQQAYTDFLTGLYNRMCCERDLAVQIDSAMKQKKTGALLYLDLDDFKHINDGLGHRYGDALLKAISHAFQRIPGIERTCYRMGGDEFVIVVAPESYDRLEIILEDIQQIFSKPWFLKDSDYYCTMSMGAVTFPDNGDSVTDLVKKADIAMYAAKKAGKNRIQFYNDGNSSSDRRRLDMVKNMREATAKNFGEFEVFYQPIIDVEQGEPRCSGAEALVRWNSSNLGFLSSTEFIPLAEYLGLINPIGNHVLLQACMQCKEWNDKGFDYKVNVNLSVIQLLQNDIVEIVENALKETGLKPEHLTLEVTESLAINDMERMKRILGRIRELGVKIALDDFGTGYSSLNHVHEISFDVIKVDQSFVKGLAEDEYSKSFIRLVSELAKTLGASICVEGIESLRQYNVLKDMKVKYIQGFYFDRPMPAKDFDRKYCREALKPASEEMPEPAKVDVKAAKSARKTAAKAAEKAPGKPEGKTAEKAPGKPEGKTAEKAPGKPEGKTAEKAPAKFVVKSAEKTPVKSEGKAAEKKPGDKALKAIQPRKK
ncbi:MAG: EAL domain-containing protein [Lachnospiraceae bacterium]|nr:EAL domain-containing protein [Lachnospiraceae bacterium]